MLATCGNTEACRHGKAFVGDQVRPSTRSKYSKASMNYDIRGTSGSAIIAAQSGGITAQMGDRPTNDKT